MGTLASELGPHVARTAPVPRVYVDANVPAALVDLMRRRWRWDVLFVLEHDDLRRATDLHHFRLARQLGRTLLTLDHDYLDARRFPPLEGGGVIVLSAPGERHLVALLAALDRGLLRSGAGAGDRPPLEGRVERVDWHEGASTAQPRRRRSRASR